LVSGDRDIVPADIPILKKQYHAVAADWESGSIAWVAKRNQIPCLILRTVSDVVNETGGEVYADYVGFQQRANESMAMLLESLPAWLNCCHEILT
jgi:adenosylhomocysteine nucleosidase